MSLASPRGDAEKAFAASDVRHEADYFVPVEHHNPMELYASTAIWEGGGKLTVYDKTQGVQNVQRYLCGVFGMKSEDIRVLSPFVGGAFGSGLRPQYQSCWPCSGHGVATVCEARADATADVSRLATGPARSSAWRSPRRPTARLRRLCHEAIAMTSQYELSPGTTRPGPALLYKCPNAQVRAQTGAPGSAHALRHACARGGLGLYGARVRDGRACRRPQTGSA